MYVFFGKANIMTLYRYIQRTGTDGVVVLRNTKPCLYIYSGANVKFLLSFKYTRAVIMKAGKETGFF